MVLGNISFEKLDAFVNKSVKWPFAFAIAGAVTAVMSIAAPETTDIMLAVTRILALSTVLTAIASCSAMAYGMYKRISGQWDESGQPTGRVRRNRNDKIRLG